MLRRLLIVTAGSLVAVVVSVLVVRASGSGGSLTKAPAAYGLAALGSAQPTAGRTPTTAASFGPYVIHSLGLHHRVLHARLRRQRAAGFRCRGP